MDAKLFKMALDKVPEVVADIVAWNAQKPVRLYSLVVDYYNCSNICTRSNRFCVDEDDLLDAIKRATRQWDCTVEEASDTKVVIRRTSCSGNYVIATYKPTASSGVVE